MVKEYYFRTGQFVRLGPTYQRHCGPTAITNLLFTLASRQKRPIKDAPSEVFTKVAGIGKKRLVYFNTSIMGRFGGTSDFLAPSYIRACLREYGIRGCRVFGILPVIRDNMVRPLDRGAVIYLEVHRHPKYGGHHMLCYGYRREGERVIYRLADGWAPAPVELDSSSIGFALFTAVLPLN